MFNKGYGQLFLSEDNGSTWHEKSYCDMLFKLHSVDYHSYDMTIYDNTENCSGDIDSSYSSSTGWKIWVNLTGNTTGITWNNNHINTTWSHVKKLLSNNSWLIFDNDTGNFSGGSNFTIFINVSGIKGNISWFGFPSNQSNITDYVTSNTLYNGTIYLNETFYSDLYFLAGTLIFDNSQFFLLILLSLWLFFISKYSEFKEMLFAYIQLIICIPLTLLLSSIVYFMSLPLISLLIFIIPILGVYIVADAIYYNKKLNKK